VAQAPHQLPVPVAYTDGVVRQSPLMYRSLSELQDSISRLIEQQGGDAPVAAFVFTKNDVCYYEIGEDGFEDLNEEKYLSDDETDQVLLELGGSDYVYEQIGEIIDDEVRRVRKQNQ